MNRIVIFTGPVQSGKTSILLRIFKDRHDVCGFLCPDQEGQRYFFDLGTKKWMEFEVKESPNQTTTINIGKYYFKSEVFYKAKQMLAHPFNQSVSFFIIDEIGKLELKGQGLEPELYTMIHNRNLDIKTMILVVRDYLLDDVIRRYNLYDADVIHIDDKDVILKFLSDK